MSHAPPSASKLSTLSSTSPLFAPNFHAAHSVLLPHSLDETFALLGRGENLRRVIALSDLFTDFGWLDLDRVAVEEGKSLKEERIRGREKEVVGAAGRGLPRQSFWFIETVPLLFGLYKNRVTITGCHTWDEEAHVALYETSADAGILIRKLRVFETASEAEGGGTWVRETIEGKSPGWLKMIVEKETQRAHKAHMETYHKLFNSPPSPEDLPPQTST